MSTVITEWARKHSRALLSLFILVAIGGLIVSRSVPVSLFPHVEFPRIVVSVDVGDIPAKQMVTDITLPLEKALRAVPGVKNIKSTTSRGSAELSVSFSWQDDMTQAMLLIQSAINQHMYQLPAGLQFEVRRMDPTIFPVLAYSLHSPHLNLVELKDLAQFDLVPRLSGIQGLAKATVLGGKDAEFRLVINPDRLFAYSLSLTDVANALKQHNQLTSVGRIEQQHQLYLLIANAQMNSINDIAATVIANRNNNPIKLSDIADVYLTTSPVWQTVTADGEQSVLVQVYQQPAGNTTQIVADVKAAIADFINQAPADLSIKPWYDQSELIKHAAMSVVEAMVIGVGLAAIVLWVFLRNSRTVMIAMCVVPMSVATTILLLHVAGMSFNIMTLGGMAAAIGLIIDDAIVVIEHIMHKLSTRKRDEKNAILQACSEIARPLTGSSAATVIIFAPLAFLDGVTGAFFKALSLTIAISLIASYTLAWLVVPLLATKWLSTKKLGSDVNSTSSLQRVYQQVLKACLNKKRLIVIPSVVLALVCYQSFLKVGTGFMPKMDEGGFVLDYRAEPGTSLNETNQLLAKLEKILQQNPAVDTYSRRTGLQLGGGLTEANEGDFFVKLKPLPRAPIDQVMSDIREQVNQQVPQLEIELVLLMEDLIGDLTSVPQPIEIKLFGNNADELLQTADSIAQLIARVKGVVDINNGSNIAGNSIEFVIDQQKAALKGVSPVWVAEQARRWFDGDVVGQFRDTQKNIDLRLWVPPSARNNATNLDGIWLKTPQGQRLALKELVSIKQTQGEPQVTRENLKRLVAVTARIENRDIGSTVREIKSLISTSQLLKKDMYFELGGLYQQQQQAFSGLITVFISAVAILFTLLLYLYEDFLICIAILSVALLAAGTVFIGLWLTGIDLNITAIMGMTMILGIVTEVAIFYFSQFKQLAEQGLSTSEALQQAGHDRIRPILMTTLAAILSLTPLAFAMGQGAEMQQPLAVAIISGLLVQLPLVLLIAPGLYTTLLKLTKSPTFKP
ncbi:efflux RND transporter permease subunit [Neptunicella marina]|uniref:Efflux RND transporter permease subunit n=1 Tax=Neptunicella marina TaxID=2125989 RepID=A0A8J6IYF8_9ALTE|nr:efflux RND transporter permease subunit [Neptunicella marina]MBC3767552.1 efflux RND transporter permease subunit [Neptunicella marina]